MWIVKYTMDFKIMNQNGGTNLGPQIFFSSIKLTEGPNAQKSCVIFNLKNYYFAKTEELPGPWAAQSVKRLRS